MKSWSNPQISVEGVGYIWQTWLYSESISLCVLLIIMSSKSFFLIAMVQAATHRKGLLQKETIIGIYCVFIMQRLIREFIGFELHRNNFLKTLILFYFAEHVTFFFNFCGKHAICLGDRHVMQKVVSAF